MCRSVNGLSTPCRSWLSISASRSGRWSPHWFRPSETARLERAAEWRSAIARDVRHADGPRSWPAACRCSCSSPGGLRAARLRAADGRTATCRHAPDAVALSSPPVSSSKSRDDGAGLTRNRILAKARDARPRRPRTTCSPTSRSTSSSSCRASPPPRRPPTSPAAASAWTSCAERQRARRQHRDWQRPGQGLAVRHHAAADARHRRRPVGVGRQRDLHRAADLASSNRCS